jgi:transcription-repair coupling factor (superfamily II helicase)
VGEFRQSQEPGADLVDEVGEVRIELPVDAHLPHDYVPSERLRLEMYKRLAEVRRGAAVDLLREALRDRYGEPPAPVDRLLEVARFRARCRKARVSEVTIQGKYVRFAPVELPESRVVRLNRLHPGSLVKAGVRTMLVPRPHPASFGAAPLRDDELLAWAGRVIDDVIDPAEKQELVK